MKSKYQKVMVIINPAAGKNEPVLNILNSVFHQYGLFWDVQITRQFGDAARLAKEAVAQGYDLVYAWYCNGIKINEQINGLLKIENDLLTYFSKLELDVMTIIRKIHMKEQKSPLATSVMFFADEIATFQGLQITKQRLYLKHLPPVSLFEAISQFARLMRNTLETLIPETKEQMINYFSDWCNLKQGELEKLILDTVNFDYNHLEVMPVQRA